MTLVNGLMQTLRNLGATRLVALAAVGFALIAFFTFIVTRLAAPGMTLLYGDREIKEEAIEPIDWTVREFVLVHSLLGRNRYSALARWPLRG